MYTIVHLILALYGAFILVCRITFYKKLTKTCKCPIEGWELKYTEYFTYFLVAISIIGLFVNIIIRLTRTQKGGAYKSLSIFLFCMMLILLTGWGVDVYCIHKIRNKLIEDECECDKNLREIIYYSTWISLIIFIFFTGICFGIFIGGKFSGVINKDYEQIGKNYKLATQRLQEELNKRKK